MDDNTTTFSEIKDMIRKFVSERDWEKFHNPKDITLALSIEVGEILEHFRFLTNDEIDEYLKSENNKREVGYEIADCLYFLTRLADICGIDVSEALEEKMKIAESKYPADKVKGKPYKYDHYQNREPKISQS